MTDTDILELLGYLERWRTCCMAQVKTDVTASQIAVLKKLSALGDTDG